MNSTWLALTGLLVAIVLLPALLAGGGFIIAIVAAVVVVVALLGGPKLWDLYLRQNVGAKGRNTDFRDLLGGGGDQTDVSDVEDGNN